MASKVRIVLWKYWILTLVIFEGCDQHEDCDLNISNLEYFNGPIVKLYNIRGDVGIPSNFLINQERKIIAKDVKTDELKFILNSQLNNLN